MALRASAGNENSIFVLKNAFISGLFTGKRTTPYCQQQISCYYLHEFQSDEDFGVDFGLIGSTLLEKKWPNLTRTI
jgi:hypothetical protein